MEFFLSPAVFHTYGIQVLSKEVKLWPTAFTNSVSRYITCIPPEQWTANVIVPLPKKGDPGPMINYWGISPQPALQVYGELTKHVSDYTYLGSMMASSASDLTKRKALVCAVFWKLERLWRSPSISTSTKLYLFNTTSDQCICHIVL